MRGRILDFDAKKGEGVIISDNFERFTFSLQDWRSMDTLPAKGLVVDFVPEDNIAKDIYVLEESRSEKSEASKNEKNKIVAGLLAIFLGGLGLHKFYLGCVGAGIITLLITIFGWVLFFIPNIIISIIVFIEGIIYLTKSGEDFQRTYVKGKRCWF